MPDAKDRTPPKSAQNNAQKVLDWREEHGDEVNGMTDVGWRRARQIASGEPLSEKTIKKISQFARHEKNATISAEHKKTPWKDAGYVAWLGWGGDTAIKTWAPRIVDKMEKQNTLDIVKNIMANFDEGKIDRDESGKFAPKGGGGSGGGSSSKDEKTKTLAKSLKRVGSDLLKDKKSMDKVFSAIPSDLSDLQKESVKRGVKSVYERLGPIAQESISGGVVGKKGKIVEDERSFIQKLYGAIDAEIGVEAGDLYTEDAEKISALMTEQVYQKIKPNLKSITNAKERGEAFYCRHMQPGTAQYEGERILVDTDSMKAMARSMVGCPVYVDHQDERDVAKADGIVSDCFYNNLDGWLWAKFVVTSDDALKAIKNGWSVSNAYVPTKFGDGGTKNNVDYDRSVLDGEFVELAIVDEPRYESAKIYSPDEFKAYQEEQKNSFEPYSNSKQKKGKLSMLKFWKKTEVKNAAEADPELTEIEINGEKYNLAEMINTVAEHQRKEKENAEKSDDEEHVNMDEKHDVDGEELSVAEIVERFKAAKNEAEEDDEHENASDEDECENEDDEEEKENSKIGKAELQAMKNAIAKGEKVTPKPIETFRIRANRGKSRYGSSK